MAKYIGIVAGRQTEIPGTATSAGATDAGKIPQLDAGGRLDPTMMPVGIGADTASVTTSEALAAGDYVNIHNVAGAFRARKADNATVGKEAHGFVLGAFASGAAAAVYFEGTNNQVSAQTPGLVYLGATGAGTATPPSTAGQVLQQIGVATSATSVNFQFQPPVTLA